MIVPFSVGGVELTKDAEGKTSEAVIKMGEYHALLLILVTKLPSNASSEMPQHRVEDQHVSDTNGLILTI